MRGRDHSDYRAWLTPTRGLVDMAHAERQSGKLVTIATFHNPYEGHIALGALRAEGIPSWLLGEHHSSVAPHLSIIVGARLVTLEAGQEQGVAILDEATKADGWETCPSCGSSVIRRRRRLSVIFALYFLFGVSTPYTPHNRRRCCYHCGYRWKFVPTH